MVRRVRDGGRFTQQGARVIVKAALGTLCLLTARLPREAKLAAPYEARELAPDRGHTG
jgi:hypothetical protein